ncbi:TetR/AcrR family transcriptional regulator [Actinomadura roseirufa]|uniref:TetR/AcrR family transcriptional regulator n=1 Tax=Actinomadura roseirufa TaxID=2094049 RepID=UPI00104191AD|nr:TetR/AcrR family transcriptional regulator [Actinomadura roseirufa]
MIESARAARSRERLIDTAAKLFYAEGITATGVDTLVARSGVSKPTLYARFGSKGALVTAVLEEIHVRRRAELERHLDDQDGPRARILAVFDWLQRFHRRDGDRGCPFLNAAAELCDAEDPAREVVVRHKRWLREVLTAQARDAGADDPGELGHALLLLLDGANARMAVEGDRDAAALARRTAERLLDAAGA